MTGHLEPKDLAKITTNLLRRVENLERMRDRPGTIAASAGGDWLALSYVGSQSISSGFGQEITVWDTFDSAGDGQSWSYSNGGVTIPAGVYLVAGCLTWQSMSAQTRVDAWCDTAQSIIPGQTVWTPGGALGTSGAFQQSFAGVIETAGTELFFYVNHVQGSARNATNLSWLIQRLGDS